MNRVRRATIQTELGTEIQCSQCKEFWPADTDFFFFSKGVPHSWCKACYLTNPSVVTRRKRWAERQRLARAAAERGDCDTGLAKGENL